MVLNVSLFEKKLSNIEHTFIIAGYNALSHNLRGSRLNVYYVYKRKSISLDNTTTKMENFMEILKVIPNSLSYYTITMNQCGF